MSFDAADDWFGDVLPGESLSYYKSDLVGRKLATEDIYDDTVNVLIFFHKCKGGSHFLMIGLTTEIKEIRRRLPKQVQEITRCHALSSSV